MTDSGLTLVSTRTGKQLGAIRLVGGKAVCEGLAEKVFRSRQRNATEPMTDEQVYEWFAKGWANGPLAIVSGSNAEDVERRYNFRDYWLHGKGAARWATWDELTDHLKKFLSAKAAQRIARQWFKERYGTDPAEEPVTDPETSRARASADHDGTELHAYWTRGEGLAKWRSSPHPWQTLHAHLAKHITDPHKLDATTSAWFIDVFGYAAGSDRNRVEHGHKPRGKRVGPG